MPRVLMCLTLWYGKENSQTWIWKYCIFFLNAWDHFLRGTGITQSLLMVSKWVCGRIMTIFYKTVSLTAYKNLVNSWVFWEFTKWSWRLLCSYFTRVWNGRFSIQNITWEGELSCTIMCHHFHFQYGSNHFRRVFKLPLFSSGVVHWTWLAHTDFFPSVSPPTDWTTGPMGGDDRDMGK